MLTTVPYATRTEGHYHASRGGEEELLEGGYSETWHSGSIYPGGEAWFVLCPNEMFAVGFKELSRRFRMLVDHVPSPKLAQNRSIRPE